MAEGIVGHQELLPLLTGVGSRCRDPRTGQFVDVSVCDPVGEQIDIGPAVRAWGAFSRELKPGFEKGSSMGVLGVRDLAVSIPAVGTRGSVMPSELTRRIFKIGIIHNHPPQPARSRLRALVALSGNDLSYIGVQVRLHPLRIPQVIVATHEFRDAADVIAGTLGMSVQAAVATMGTVDAPSFWDTRDPEQSRRFESLGWKGFAWRDLDAQMLIPNPLWRRFPS